jgi:cation diffusion facilitator CzcD-associated flavoprotein CzcO
MNVGVTPTAASEAGQTTVVPVLIIGCGFGGIAMAIALKNDGINDFRILERASDVGGVWRDNSYPGAACDVVSRLYSFSFDHESYAWSTAFAPQGEILDYIHKCVAKYDIRRHVQFNTLVISASFDERSGQWTVRTEAGQIFVTPILISATGLFNRLNIPDIPGRDEFKGVQFHSARWNHDFDLAGRTVAVIGNGASAVQFVPKIAEKVKRLYLFQRTPQYVMARTFFPGTSEWDAWLQKHPWLRWLARLKIYLTFERIIFRRFWFPHMRLQAEAGYYRMLEAKVKEPELRRKLTPNYPLGCKRVLVSDVWLDTMVRPNVEVVTAPIERIMADGVQTGDAQLRQVDAIIFGTGFRVHDYLAPMRVTGLGGKDLNEMWREGAEAYLGIAVTGFPNFFMLYGPNTNAVTSIIFMLECQARYIVNCIRKRENNRAHYMNVRADAQRRFIADVRQRLSRTVPAMAGCLTYFKNEYGVIDTNWPGYTTEYGWRTRHVRTSDYEFVTEQAAQRR